MAILKIRDKDGNIQEIVVIKGDKGDTPIKGEDYFTPEDIEQIVEQVKEDMPESVLGNKKLIFNEDGTVTWEAI